MKKIIALLLLICAFLPLNQALAQRAGEYNVTPRDDSWNKSGVFANIGFGLSAYENYSNYWEDRCFSPGLSIDLGYRYHFGQGFYWNIVKVGYSNPRFDRFGEASTMRFMTGFRYMSAPILADRPVYTHFDLGYFVNVANTNYWDGFAYEIGVGVAISRTISLGIAWEGSKASNFYHYRWPNTEPIGIFALQLGINF